MTVTAPEIQKESGLRKGQIIVIGRKGSRYRKQRCISSFVAERGETTGCTDAFLSMNKTTRTLKDENGSGVLWREFNL